MIILYICIGIWLAIAFCYFMSEPSWDQLCIGLLLPVIVLLTIIEEIRK